MASCVPGPHAAGQLEEASAVWRWSPTTPPPHRLSSVARSHFAPYTLYRKVVRRAHPPPSLYRPTCASTVQNSATHTHVNMVH